MRTTAERASKRLRRGKAMKKVSGREKDIRGVTGLWSRGRDPVGLEMKSVLGVNLLSESPNSSRFPD